MGERQTKTQVPDGRTKIVDEQEVIRWYEEGRTYKWMAQEYLRKYNIQIGVTAFSNFRNKKGLPPRAVHNDDLIPWRVKGNHRFSYPAIMLRAEGRRRLGEELPEDLAGRLDRWLGRMAEMDAVVDYYADTEDGFFYVARQPGEDLVRVPPKSRRGRTGHNRM